MNTQSCQIRVSEKSVETQLVPLHPTKVCCGFTASFITGPYFFEVTSALGHITVTVTGQRYECLFGNHGIPALQQLRCVNRIIFMQDGAPLHIANTVKQQLKRHFRNARFTSRQFPTPWLFISSDLNPCDFWMWCCLKDVLFSSPIAHLAKLKARITQHILNVTPETL